MVLVLEILAGIAAVMLAAFIVIVLTRRRRSGAAPRIEPGGAVAAPAPKKTRKVSDTKAFRQYAHGDIDHDEYREILEKNQKESG
jgi:uncharacterized membrane protein